MMHSQQQLLFEVRHTPFGHYDRLDIFTDAQQAVQPGSEIDSLVDQYATVSIPKIQRPVYAPLSTLIESQRANQNPVS
jgi:hypothetical protein